MSIRITVITFLITACASSPPGEKSLSRKAKVCSYNFLVGWMGSGNSTSSAMTGDAKKVLESYNSTRNLSNVCEENQNTENEEF